MVTPEEIYKAHNFGGNRTVATSLPGRESVTPRQVYDAIHTPQEEPTEELIDVEHSGQPLLLTAYENDVFMRLEREIPNQLLKEVLPVLIIEDRLNLAKAQNFLKAYMAVVEASQHCFSIPVIRAIHVLENGSIQLNLRTVYPEASKPIVNLLNKEDHPRNGKKGKRKKTKNNSQGNTTELRSPLAAR